MSRFKPRTDPFPSRSHSLLTQWHPGSQLVPVPSIVRRAYELAGKLEGKARLIALAQLETGARAREIINIKAKDVATTGHTLVRAGKGSATRVAHSHTLAALKAEFTGDQDALLFAPYNYWQYRRAILRVADDNIPHSAKRRAPTNQFRRACAAVSEQLSRGDRAVIQRYLGHKCQASIDHYLNSEG